MTEIVALLYLSMALASLVLFLALSWRMALKNPVAYLICVVYFSLMWPAYIPKVMP